MEQSQLLAHCGSSTITREKLKVIQTPAGSPTHQPLMVKKVVRRAEVKGHRHGFRVSGVLLIDTFVNIKPRCFRSGSSRRTRWHNTWRLYAFSTSRHSRKPGASRKHPTRRRPFTCQRSSVRRKWRDSSTQL